MSASRSPILPGSRRSIAASSRASSRATPVLSRDEIVRSLNGAWELFLDRPDALRYFDLSVDGFWRSFRAIVLVVPSYLLAVLADRLARLPDVPGAGIRRRRLLRRQGASRLALDWVALPILLAAVAGPLSVEKGYSAFVIARNWGSVISVAPFGAIGLLAGSGPHRHGYWRTSCRSPRSSSCSATTI